MGLPAQIEAISRHREMDRVLYPSGQYTNQTTGIIRTKSAPSGMVKYCDDWVGNRDGDNPLLIVTETYDPVFADGVVNGKVLVNWPLNWWVNKTSLSATAFWPTPDWATMASQACAAMNPNRPAFNMLSFGGESRDLPSLIATVPSSLMKRARILRHYANFHLSWEFGWKPLVSDTQKALAAADAVSQRLKWLNDLAAGKSVYRRYQLPPQDDVRNANTLVSTETETYTQKHRYTDRRHADSWVTSRWKAVFPRLTIPSDPARRLKQARDLTYGLTSMSAVEAWWQLLPWSWLTDWFTDVGQFLAVVNNSLLLQLESLCWCRRSTASRWFAIASSTPGDITLRGSGTYRKIVLERKDIRSYVLGQPTLSLPALTSRQLAILASVALQRVVPSNPGPRRIRVRGRRIRVRQ